MSLAWNRILALASTRINTADSLLTIAPFMPLLQRCDQDIHPGKRKTELLVTMVVPRFRTLSVSLPPRGLILAGIA